MQGYFSKLLFSVLTILSILLIVVSSDYAAEPLIRLNYAQFDGASLGEPAIWPEYKMPQSSPDDYGYFIVQFSGPITQDMKSILTESGAHLISYLPDYAFIVRMSPREAELLRESESPDIAWIGLYQPAYKLSQRLCEFVTEGERILPSDSPSLYVRFFPEHSRLDHIANFEQVVLDSGADIKTVGSSYSPRGPQILISVSGRDLGQLLPMIASMPDVLSIEFYSAPRILNDTARWVVQSNVQGSCTVWNHGIHGENQIIGVGDTGVDADSCFFFDSARGLPNSTVNTSQRKIIAYFDYTGEAGWDEDGHGTHIAGTLAGDNYTNREAYDTNDGIAYCAKLVVQDIGDKDSLSSIPFGLDSYFRQAYNAGARIHSNSWGAQTGSAGDNSYTFRCRSVDEFMWDYPDFLIFFANGNDGPDDNTVNPPATAKNCVSVGSCKNPRDGASQDDMALSSSHGPARDGRNKPTITAPGEYIMSAESDGNISSFNCGTAPMQGTSMACPVAAASAALARQYFTEGYYPTGNRNAADAFEPSGALLKAILINGAVDMTGS
ncbi:MAG: S8 family serine peptidase, partial [Candidatus Coatesbacteria bacterium]|nr:S8 family serine peptidase [Candidatus Coatesbacteria bacterium]